jgi:hypothetical protein
MWGSPASSHGSLLETTAEEHWYPGHWIMLQVRIPLLLELQSPQADVPPYLEVVQLLCDLLPRLAHK